jgi:hypothetical protein
MKRIAAMPSYGKAVIIDTCFWYALYVSILRSEKYLEG